MMRSARRAAPTPDPRPPSLPLAPAPSRRDSPPVEWTGDPGPAAGRHRGRRRRLPRNGRARRRDGSRRHPTGRHPHRVPPGRRGLVPPALPGGRHRAPAPGVAPDPGRRGRPGRLADRIREDPDRLPRGHRRRLPGPVGRHRGHLRRRTAPGARRHLHLAPAGARRRCRGEPAHPAGGDRHRGRAAGTRTPAAHRGGPYGGHAGRRARRHAQAPTRPPGHHPRVPLPAADRRVLAGRAGQRPYGHRRRGPHPGP